MATDNPKGGEAGDGKAQPGLGERIDHISSTAQQLVNEARSMVTDLEATLDVKGRVERSPYGTLAAAVGVGYVLGGGLFTPLTARILRLGFRLAALPFVKDELLGMAEAAIDNLVEARAGGDGHAAGERGGASGTGAAGPVSASSASGNGPTGPGPVKT